MAWAAPLAWRARVLFLFYQRSGSIVVPLPKLVHGETYTWYQGLSVGQAPE